MRVSTKQETGFADHVARNPDTELDTLHALMDGDLLGEHPNAIQGDDNAIRLFKVLLLPVQDVGRHGLECPEPGYRPYAILRILFGRAQAGCGDHLPISEPAGDVGHTEDVIATHPGIQTRVPDNFLRAMPVCLHRHVEHG